MAEDNLEWMADGAESTKPHHKKVLLFGKTGSGKSTVANALVTGGVERVVFPSSDGARGCTRKIQIETGRGWTVVDTVGLGEAEGGTISNTEAKKMLTTFLKNVKTEYSHIIYVIKKGRIISMDETTWVLFSSIFDGGEDGFVVLFTGANEEWLEEQKDLLPEYMRIPEYPILVTDIPPIRTGVKERRNVEIRRDSIQKLEADLENLFRERNHTYVVPRIAQMDDEELEDKSMSIIRRVVEVMKTLLGNSREKWMTALRMFSNLISVAGFVCEIVSAAT